MSKNNHRLVLMSCCAPCSAGAITQLEKQGADFCVLFYNPNIAPEAEYQKRLTEQIRLCEQLGVKYVVGEYDHDAWLSCIRGLENEPERGRRCASCFKHRIEWGAKWARANGYDTLATVFGVSKHKSQAQVDDAAQDLNIEYIPINWDEGLRQEIIKKAGFYRQNYCGCE
ncbi:MAG: epoxyqueuosine reductase QueH, partial [Alphaproteobacteria bacterium]|nr:epoxyqueuosine reductase QueH [Alphaproteobacteria bacterium]